MTKNPELLGTFSDMVDAPDFGDRLWLATVSALAFIGGLCGLLLLGTAVAQTFGLVFL